MLGWKVMRFDPHTNELVSGADSRIRFKCEIGGLLCAPEGIWFYPSTETTFWSTTQYMTATRCLRLGLCPARSSKEI